MTWPEGAAWSKARRWAGPHAEALLNVALPYAHEWRTGGTILTVLDFLEADVCIAERDHLLDEHGPLTDAEQTHVLWEELSDFAYLRSLPSLYGQHLARALGGCADALAVTSGWDSALSLAQRLIATSPTPCVLVCGLHDGVADAQLIHQQAAHELRPVVIADIGAVTPLGDTFPATLAALNEAKSGISAAPLLSKLRCTAAAAGAVTTPLEQGSRSLALAHRAIAEAGGTDPTVPIVWAPMWDGDSASVEFGTSLTLEATCSGGIRALVEAARLVAMGECEEALAVAVVARNNPLYASQFAQLTALSQWPGDPAAASRPFDHDRSGMVLAEAAVAIRVRAGDTGVLLAGNGTCHDHTHPTAPSVPAIVVAIEQALTEAHLPATAVDSISTHGTGTRLNDAAEADALRQVFGERLAKIPATALKSSTGHASSASSLLEVAVLAETLRSGIVPPSLNCPRPDVELDLAATARNHPADVGVSTSFGFGGQHTAIVLRKG